MKYILSLFISLLLIGAAIVAYYDYKGAIPSSYVPWKPLDLSQPPGLFTKIKINYLRDDQASCHAALDTAGIEYKPAPDRQAGSCELTQQTFLHQSTARYSAPVRAKCAVIAALAGWEKHVVQPLAQQYFNSDVLEITHYGIFACRNVRASSTRMSQHASANAIDIAAFTLTDGTLISVLRDWGKENQKDAFLRAVHAQSCDFFNGVMGPEYNALHADHFHLDLGPYRICR